MSNIRWRDNGIILGSLGCVLIFGLFATEIYIQNLAPTSSIENIAIVIDEEEETSNELNIEETSTLTNEETAQAKAAAEQIEDLVESGMSINWETLAKEFPELNSAMWLEAGNQLSESDQPKICELIYGKLWSEDPTLENKISQRALFQLAKFYSSQDEDDKSVTHYQQLLAASPNHSASLVNLSILLARLDRHKEAVAMAQRTVDATSGEKKAKAYSIMASSLISLGDTEKAEELYDRSIQYRVQHAPTWLNLAQIRVDNERDPEVILSTFDSAISLQPNFEEALLDRARYFWKMGDLDSARSDLENLRDSAPSYVPGRWTLIHLYIALNKKRTAQKELKELKTLGLSEKEIAFAEAIEIYQRDGKIKARPSFDSIEDVDAGASDAWLRFYKVSTRKKNADATEVISQLEPLFDDRWMREISRNKAAEIYGENKQYESAEALLKRLIERFPESALYTHNLGKFYLDFSHADLAIPTLLRAVKLTSENRKTLFQLARAYTANKQTNLAIETYQEYLQGFPNNDAVHHNLAILFNKTGQTELAIEHYLRAVELDPELTNSKLYLQRIYRQQGNLDQAIVQLDDILAQDAVHHQARKEKVEILYEQKNFQAAIDEIDRLLTLVPEHLKARELKIDILYQQQNYAAAIDEIDQLLTQTPKHIKMQLLKTDIFKEQGNYEAAANILLSLNEEDFVKRGVVKLYNIGVRALDENQLTVANHSNEKVLSVEPNHRKALINLTESYNRGEQYQNTIDLINSYNNLPAEDYKIASKFAIAHYHLGNYQLVAEILHQHATQNTFSRRIEQIYIESQNMAELTNTNELSMQ